MQATPRNWRRNSHRHATPLCGSPVDGILVELCIHELDLQSCDLLSCERSFGHCLFEGLLDEFHCLVEVLDTLGAVEEDVVVLETDNTTPSLVLVMNDTIE